MPANAKTVAWKVLTIEKNKYFSECVTYGNRFAFSVVKIEDEVIKWRDDVTPMPVQLGYAVSLVNDGGTLKFEEPKRWFDDDYNLKVTNNTDKQQKLSLGFYPPHVYVPSHMVYFEHVPAGSSTLVNFKPALHTFFQANISQGNVFDKAYPSGYEITPPLDLPTLVEKPEYRITYDEDTGKASIKQVVGLANLESRDNPSIPFM
jgi:hypothetical protein